MTLHPLKTTYTTGTNVSKGSILSYETLWFLAIDANDVRARDLSGTLSVVVPVGTSGRIFWNDPTDTGTADDGLTCLHDVVGNIFKIRPIAAGDLTATVLNAAFGAGGLDTSIIPGAGTRKLLARGDTGNYAAQSVATLVAWFDDFFGSTAWRATPSTATIAGTVTAVPVNKGWRSGGRGGYQTALLFADGRVGIAGRGSNGADPINGGTHNYRYQKVAFGDGVPRNVVKLWTGGLESLFCLTDDNIVWACGYNSNGQLGIGSTANSDTWQEITYFRSNALTVSQIYTAPCGLSTWFLCTNGQLYYTGFNGTGVAGDGTTAQKTTPVRCGTLTGVTDVFPGDADALGGNHTMVGCIAAGGALYAWGYNANYELGLNNTTQQTAPVATGLTNVTKARFGEASFALKSDGTLWSCGFNGEGGPCQTTFTANTQVWTQIASLGTSVTDFEASSGRFCSAAAIITGKNLRTWGYNGSGQLGNGNTTAQNTIQTPSGAWQGTVDEVAFGGAGPGGFCGSFIRCGNAFYGSGYNSNGNLGIGGTANVSTFARVLNITGNVQAWYLRSGNNDGAFGGFVVTDTEAAAWGSNVFGQTGTHEGNLRNIVTIAQPILVAGIVKGDKGDLPLFGALTPGNAVIAHDATTIADGGSPPVTMGKAIAAALVFG